MINNQTKINLIIGNPITQSLSPILHNLLYKQYNLDSKFVFLAARIESQNLQTVVNSILLLGINALTVTIPHKVEIIKYLDKIDKNTQKIGAVNTVVVESNQLVGYNTDWLGTLLPLANHFGYKIENFDDIPQFLTGKKVGLVGSGGASRAMVFACLASGAEVYIFNRTIDTAHKIQKDMEKIGFDKIKVFELKDIEETSKCNILVNSTSVGMEPNIDKTPIPKEFLNSEQIIFDAIYKPKQTQLVLDAREIGATTICGQEMFIYQAIYQFELQTGVRPNSEMVRKLLEKIESN